jgi:carboxymethylenebutenolidase
MIEQTVDIATKDGKTTTFIVHPERGGPFPVILFYMDAPAIREELRDMARRLATSGYYVMLPNMYYRSGVMEIGPIPPAMDAPERKAMQGYMNSLTISMVMDDTEGLLKYADGQDAAGKGAVGCVGYCMSGQYAINAAARWPDRVKAAASLYGTKLVSDAADSPHLMAKKAKGELYIGYAERDHYVPQEMIDALKKQLDADNVKNAELEMYPDADHGFAFPLRPVYKKDAAERHWERLLALYKRNLKG